MASIKKIIIAILLWESRLVIRKYKPRIVAITGSVGKTSAKDAIFEVMKRPTERLDDNPNAVPFIRKSDKSFNSEIGVPLTVLGVKNAWRDPFAWFGNIARGIELLLFRVDYPAVLVLEVGADHPGDIESLTRWLKPDVAVITKIGDVPVHVEFFASPEAVLREKLFLARAVRPGGTVVLFGDDEKLASLAFEGRNVITYGLGASNAVRGDAVAVRYQAGKPAGMTLAILHKGDRAQVSLDAVLGTAHAYPVLAAAAVGISDGQSLAAIAAAFASYQPPRGRMNVIAGLNDSTLMDDTYNSSPTALAQALATLASVHGEGAGRRIAVLGDMMELGQYSADEHRKAGELAARSCDLLVTVGQRARGMADGAVAAGMSPSAIVSFDDSASAAAQMPALVNAGDVVLVKGSQSPRLERVTQALLADPSRAAELLVRQDREWLLKK